RGIAVYLQRPVAQPFTSLRIDHPGAYQAGRASGGSTEDASGIAGVKQLYRRSRHQGGISVEAPEHLSGLISNRDSPLAGRTAGRGGVPIVHPSADPTGISLSEERGRGTGPEREHDQDTMPSGVKRHSKSLELVTGDS